MSLAMLRCFYSLLYFGLIIELLVAALPMRAHADDLAIRWQPLAEGLEIAEVNVVEGTFFSSQLTLIRSDSELYDVGVAQAKDFGMQRSSAKNLCKLSKSSLCINANFFDENGETLGLAIKQGNIAHKMHKGGNVLTGVFFTKRDSAEIVSRADFNPNGVLSAVQAGPRILVKGTPVAGLRDSTSTSRRSGVCIDKKQRVVFFIVSSGFTGVSLQQLERVLIADQVQCQDALNFDGGGSSQMYVSDLLPEASSDKLPMDIEGRDEVPVVVTLTKKRSGNED